MNKPSGRREDIIESIATAVCVSVVLGLAEMGISAAFEEFQRRRAKAEKATKRAKKKGKSHGKS